MKLKEYRDDYYFFSGKLSDISRQLGLAGIAIIWLFQMDVKEGGHEIPDSFYTPLLFLISSLSLDFLQYLVQTITWAIFFYVKNKKHRSLDVEVERPGSLVVLPWILFGAKVMTLLISYILLFKILFGKYII